MYYINNKIYICHVTNVTTSIYDIEGKGFSKRNLVFVEENAEAIVMLDGTISEILENTAMPFEITKDWMSFDQSEDKVILCFYDKDFLNNIAFSYYSKVTDALGISNSEEVIKAVYPLLDGASIVDTFSFSEENAKGIPVGLMVQSSSELTKFSDYWVDKVNSAKEKIVMKELAHIVSNNLEENKVEFADEAEVLNKILELNGKDALAMQDWHDLYSLAKDLTPLPDVLEDYEMSTIGEMHLVNALYENAADSEGYISMYKKAFSNNIKYFRDIELRIEY